MKRANPARVVSQQLTLNAVQAGSVGAGSLKIFLFASALAAATPSFGAGPNFPTVRRCISPDLHWMVRCVTEGERDGYLHKLFLSRLAAPKEAFVCATGRSCDVLWSSDSQRFAITDWSGSTTAEIYLVEVSGSRKAEPFEVKGVTAILQKEEPESHCYYEALKWEGTHRLLICVFGHRREHLARLRVLPIRRYRFRRRPTCEQRKRRADY